MVPTPYEQINPRPKLITMSNHNTYAIDVSTNFSGMKLFHIGKDMVPVSIMHMRAVTALTWKKYTFFSSLKTFTYFLSEVHSITDAIYLVNNLPINTSEVYQ